MLRILAVIDMQKDFIDGSLGTPEAAAITAPLASFAANWEGPVIFTRDTHGADYLNTQEGRRLPVPHCLKDSEGWQLADPLEEVRRSRNCPVFDKETFGSRSLGEYLALQNELWGVKEVVLTGVCTDICVISNALLIKAFLPETTVAVISSLCAGVTPQSHGVALEAMKACQIDVR